MNIITTEIPEVLIIEPKVFQDERGFFFEAFNYQIFTEQTGIFVNFVQDNHSASKHNVLRGLHYQIQQPQGKLIRAIAGTIFDVAVDIRKSSPTFGKWVGCELSDVNKRQLWIPPVLPTVLLSVQKQPKFYTKLQIIMHPNTIGVLFGTIPI